MHGNNAIKEDDRVTRYREDRGHGDNLLPERSCMRQLSVTQNLVTGSDIGTREDQTTSCLKSIPRNDEMGTSRAN